jgi:hypothetical protein
MPRAVTSTRDGPSNVLKLRPLSGHSGHGRTRCWPALVAIGPKAGTGKRRQPFNVGCSAVPYGCRTGPICGTRTGFAMP